jgi:hypothetical protein
MRDDHSASNLSLMGETVSAVDNSFEWEEVRNCEPSPFLFRGGISERCKRDYLEMGRLCYIALAA